MLINSIEYKKVQGFTHASRNFDYIQHKPWNDTFGGWAVGIQTLQSSGQDRHWRKNVIKTALLLWNVNDLQLLPSWCWHEAFLLPTACTLGTSQIPYCVHVSLTSSLPLKMQGQTKPGNIFLEKWDILYLSFEATSFITDQITAGSPALLNLWDCVVSLGFKPWRSRTELW